MVKEGSHNFLVAYYLQLGFDSVHFARIDYQDRAKRKGDKSLEVIWRGSKTFGSSSQVSNCNPCSAKILSLCFFLYATLCIAIITCGSCRFLQIPFLFIIALLMVSILK